MKRLRGTNLVELIGVMVVILILCSIGVGIASVAIHNSKRATAEKGLADYASVFTQVCTTHPGIVKDRKAAWGGSETYTSQEGLKRLVLYMNELLPEERAFVWNSAGYFESLGGDPWKGKYILTEYPVTAYENYYDPSLREENSIECSLWCTGNSDYLLETKSIGSDEIGVALRYCDGLVIQKWSGSKDMVPSEELNNATINMS